MQRVHPTPCSAAPSPAIRGASTLSILLVKKIAPGIPPISSLKVCNRAPNVVSASSDPTAGPQSGREAAPTDMDYLTVERVTG